MRRLALGITVLLASVMCGYAQSNPAESAKGSSTNSTTVQGCLNRTGSGYTLTDISGTSFELAGDTSKLSDHVGHEVKITGTTAVTGEVPGVPSSVTKDTAPARIDVTGVKHVASTCTSKLETGKHPMDEKSPADQKPPISERPPVPHRR